MTPVTIPMPLGLTPELIRAVREAVNAYVKLCPFPAAPDASSSGAAPSVRQFVPFGTMPW